MKAVFFSIFLLFGFLSLIAAPIVFILFVVGTNDYPDEFSVADPLMGRRNQVAVGYYLDPELGPDASVQRVLSEDIDWLLSLDSTAFSHEVDLNSGTPSVEDINIVGVINFGLVPFNTTIGKKVEYFTFRVVLDDSLPSLQEGYEYQAVLVFPDNDRYMPLGKLLSREGKLVNGFRIHPKYMTSFSKFALITVSVENPYDFKTIYEVGI